MTESERVENSGGSSAARSETRASSSRVAATGLLAGRRLRDQRDQQPDLLAGLEHRPHPLGAITAGASGRVSRQSACLTARRTPPARSRPR